MNRGLAVFLLSSIIGLPASAADAPALQPNISVKDQGARHGQAIAAARICPGARRTAKAETLGNALTPDDRAVFDRESAVIVAAWEKAFSCTDVDPAQTREINGCRKSKILSCTSAWREIGPEGADLPGLLDFKPGTDDDQP